MDKPKGNTITIKLNGEDQKYIEEAKGSQPKASSESFTTINDPIDIDQDVLLETAAAQESIDESFDWMIPETSENDIKEYKIVHTPKAKTGSSKKLMSISKTSKINKGSHIGSILFSTIFAIIIGIVFGFMMLKLVIADHGQKAAALPNGEVVNGTNPVNGTETSGTNSNSTIVKALNTFVIQEGIYSSMDAAKAAAKLAGTNGLPTKTITMNGKEYLFLGVADSQDNAKKLGSLYKQNGVEVFSKPLATEEKTVANLNENDKSFLTASVQIYQSLAKITSSGLIANSSASVDAVNAIDQLLKSNSIKSSAIKNLRTELAAAEEKVKSYQKTKDPTTLSDAQQHLLNFLAYYYSL